MKAENEEVNTFETFHVHIPHEKPWYACLQTIGIDS